MENKQLYKGKEKFISSTSFFIDQMITKEQILSLHYSMINLEVVHKLNSCSNEFGKSCKQTLDNIKKIHKVFNVNKIIFKESGQEKKGGGGEEEKEGQEKEENEEEKEEENDEENYNELYETLVDSYFVGTDKGYTIPIFLTNNGKFLDFFSTEYWIDYKENDSNDNNKVPIFIDKKTFESNGGYNDTNKDYIYTVEKIKTYKQKIQKFIGDVDWVSFNLFMETIKRNVFDLNILGDILEIYSMIEIKKRPQNSILVGISEYNRNYPPRYIFLTLDGRFVDEFGNMFFPIYETKIIKIQFKKDRERQPICIYLFQKIKNTGIDNSDFDNDLVAYNYQFNNPKWVNTNNSMYNQFWKGAQSIGFSVLIGLSIDFTYSLGANASHFLHDLSKPPDYKHHTTHSDSSSQSTTKHTSSPTKHTTTVDNPIKGKIHSKHHLDKQHKWLEKHHSKYENYKTALKNNTAGSNESSYQSYVDKYQHRVRKHIHELAMSDASQGKVSDLYQSIYDHHKDVCEKSVEGLLKEYPEFNFPSPTSSASFTPCQVSFLKEWAKNSGSSDQSSSFLWNYTDDSKVTKDALLFNELEKHVSDKYANDKLQSDTSQITEYLQKHDYTQGTVETITEKTKEKITDTITIEKDKTIVETEKEHNYLGNYLQDSFKTAIGSISEYIFPVAGEIANDKYQNYESKLDKLNMSITIPARINSKKIELEELERDLHYMKNSDIPNSADIIKIYEKRKENLLTEINYLETSLKTLEESDQLYEVKGNVVERPQNKVVEGNVAVVEQQPNN